MNRASKITIAVSSIVVAGLAALAAPAVASVGYRALSANAQASGDESPDTKAEANPDADPDWPDGYVHIGDGTWIPRGGPGECEESVVLSITRQGAGSSYAKLLGADLVDMGPREFADGAVGYDDQGRIKTYTVEPGDALYAIGDRFCFYNPLAIGDVNHTRTIHPGDVLILRPDPTLASIPYYSPTDAPAGFLQIPYQVAIEAMGDASAAGDVDAMRSIWIDTLAPMTFNQSDVDAIARALEDGDLSVLREMFP